MNYSNHAQQRMQQRGIRQEAVDYLLAYGTTHHDHHGGMIVWLDKQSRRRLEREEGPQILRRLEKQLDAYAVVSHDDCVITVGHRYKRVKL